ncbi:hypothetical protein B0T14DRAFT_241620 [Immersiella caudata]|uniref:Uncharacterized protein n=1 Tax=Immersiella caudata TaxID=314043 RepID=A0AA39WT08_9PEZI|nr:hypothetical protein B0T14DRAFT_241620 [Immersiella caudata]
MISRRPNMPAFCGPKLTLVQLLIRLARQSGRTQPLGHQLENVVVLVPHHLPSKRISPNSLGQKISAMSAVVVVVVGLPLMDDDGLVVLAAAMTAVVASVMRDVNMVVIVLISFFLATEHFVGADSNRTGNRGLDVAGLGTVRVVVMRVSDSLHDLVGCGHCTDSHGCSLIFSIIGICCTFGVSEVMSDWV